MGSEHFIAPEVLREQHYSPACDMWVAREMHAVSLDLCKEQEQTKDQVMQLDEVHAWL